MLVRPSFSLPFVVLASITAAACSSSPATPPSDLTAEEATQLLGDDRVGDALRTAFEKTPTTLEAYEALFAVGRQCSRTDSKEIFIVEEPNTRLGGNQRDTSMLLPRAAITGCGVPGTKDSDARAASLMAAVVSRPEGEAAAKGEWFALEQVEAIAHDRTTGLTNFYATKTSDSGAKVLQRFVERADGSVVEIEKEAGKALVERAADGRRCFACHTDGMPIMNELSDPWTSWVSVRNTKAHSSPLSGETASLVAEADGTSGRTTFAGGLEVTVRVALRSHIFGVSGQAGTGLGAALAEGRAAGGWARLVRSVFCETALNYLSGTDTVPVELFVDPAGAVGEGVLRPPSANDGFPRLFPVRSLFDQTLEEWLVSQKYLSPEAVLAVRLVDDENDVFSDTRCKLATDVLAKAPDAGPSLDAAVRAVLADALTKGTFGASGPRRTYVETLLDDTRKDERITARKAYGVVVHGRVDEGAAGLANGTGRAALEARMAARQDRARQLFPGTANPLPHFGAAP